jgi:hypothetical protein
MIGAGGERSQKTPLKPRLEIASIGVGVGRGLAPAEVGEVEPPHALQPHVRCTPCEPHVVTPGYSRAQGVLIRSQGVTRAGFSGLLF